MESNRQISEFNKTLKFLSSQGFSDVQIMLWFPWGDCWNPDDNYFQYQAMPLSRVENYLMQTETKFEEKRSGNEIYIRNIENTWELRFCHELDLHIFFDDRSEIVTGIERFWSERGLDPKEFTLPQSI